MFGLKKVVGRSSEQQWDIESGIDQEDEAPTVEGVEAPVFGTPYVYDPTGEKDYYEGVVKASISSGGRYGVHEIPVNWLRMILSGLEGKEVGIEAMLEVPRGEGQGAQGAAYESMFPTEQR